MNLVCPSPAAPPVKVVLMKAGDVAVPVPALTMAPHIAVPVPALFVALRQRGKRRQYCDKRQRELGDPRSDAAAGHGTNDAQ